MAQLFKNNARATLGGTGLASTVGVDGTFSVATGKGVLFPGIDPIVAGTYFDVTIQDATNIEIIRIKKCASDVFTIDSRAREGTTAVTFASGAIVALRMTAAVAESMMAHQAATSAAHAATAISNAPAGNIAATTVQAAINELDAEKATPAQVATAVSDHVALADPHTQYALDTDLASKQAADATLTALAGLATGVDMLPYFTGTDLAGQTSLTPFGRTVLDDANEAAVRVTIGTSHGRDVVWNFNVNTALSATHFGTKIYYNGTAAGTLTLPDPATGVSGATITVINISAFPCTIARFGTETIYALGTSGTSIVLNPHESIVLFTNTGSWFQSANGVKVPLSKYFQSVAQTITSAGALTIAHGLVSAPTLVTAHLVCLTAEGGYSIGDVVLVSMGQDNAAATTGIGLSVVPDATNLNIRMGNRANVFALVHKTTGAYFDTANVNWSLYFRAWA